MKLPNFPFFYFSKYLECEWNLIYLRILNGQLIGERSYSPIISPCWQGVDDWWFCTSFLVPLYDCDATTICLCRTSSFTLVQFGVTGSNYRGYAQVSYSMFPYVFVFHCFSLSLCRSLFLLHKLMQILLLRLSASIVLDQFCLNIIVLIQQFSVVTLHFKFALCMCSHFVHFLITNWLKQRTLWSLINL